jgi:hypothetical protein
MDNLRKLIKESVEKILSDNELQAVNNVPLIHDEMMAAEREEKIKQLQEERKGLLAKLNID